MQFEPDYTQKTDDLYSAYSFAQQTPLSKENIKKAHQLLTANIPTDQQQGKIRHQSMYVTTLDGRIEYVATEPS